MTMILAVAQALLLASAAAAQAGGGGQQPPASCPTSCGNVAVPYPFGVGAGCSLPGFNLTCDQAARGAPRLLLGDGTLVVVEISLSNATVRVVNTAGAVNISFSSGLTGNNGTWGGGLGVGGPFVVSEARNQLVVTGCNIQATLVGGSGNVVGGCSSFCPINDMFTGAVFGNGAAEACSGGIGCCQTAIAFGRPSYGVQLTYLDPSRENNGEAPAVRVAESGWFDGATRPNSSRVRDTSPRTPVPVVLDWVVASTPVVLPGVAADNSTCPTDAAAGACRSSYSSCINVTGNYRSGYVCRCRKGYDGNPYVAGGCQDIDECKIPGMCFGMCTNTAGDYICQCPRGAPGNPYILPGCVKSSIGLSVGLGVGSGAGLLFLVLGATFIARKIKHRKARMQRQKFFKQNRGHLLQQMVSQKADIAERMIIPLAELERATNNFDKAREVGGGGHGTVYKGILSDLHVVAIKKSKVTIQREIDEFINEVAILSQINHRNVVKLFGCCLETEVPLLVYEFISNGTLYHHLHVEGPTSLPWEHRLRIGMETARALAYLHMAVSFPIIHRDIKSHNILLDGSLTAKVSDFGASRFIPTDQTGVTTAVQGTLGYLDPMYYYTGRLNEKSDVYSFGVLLIELLTRKKPYSYRSPNDDSLIAHFTTFFSDGNLVDILDPQVMEEGGEQVEEAAALAAACVKLKAEDRPTMRQVEMALEGIQASLRQVTVGSVSTMIPWKKPMVVNYSLADDRTREESTQSILEEEVLLGRRYPR